MRIIRVHIQAQDCLPACRDQLEQTLTSYISSYIRVLTTTDVQYMSVFIFTVKTENLVCLEHAIR